MGSLWIVWFDAQPLLLTQCCRLARTGVGVSWIDYVWLAQADGSINGGMSRALGNAEKPLSIEGVAGGGADGIPPPAGVKCCGHRGSRE